MPYTAHAPGTNHAGGVTNHPATSINNAGGVTNHPSGGSPPPPGAPVVWYDPQDIDLSANSTLTDGQAITTWKNKGTLGSAWDLLQATGARQPTFKKVAAAGKMNGLSSVLSTTSQYMQTALRSARPTANTIIAICLRMTNLAALYAPFDGQTGGRAGVAIAATTGVISIDGTGSVTTNKAVTGAGFFDTIVFTYAGANSFLTINGSDSSPVVNPLSQALTGFTLGSVVPPPVFVSPQDSMDILVYEDSTTRAQIATFYAAKYGATPQ